VSIYLGHEVERVSGWGQLVSIYLGHEVERVSGWEQLVSIYLGQEFCFFFFKLCNILCHLFRKLYDN